MDVLDDLYYGRIDPHERAVSEDAEIREILACVVRDEDRVSALLSDAGKDLLRRFSNTQSRLTDLMERDAFREGFRLAVKLMIAVMNTADASASGD